LSLTLPFSQKDPPFFNRPYERRRLIDCDLIHDFLSGNGIFVNQITILRRSHDDSNRCAKFVICVTNSFKFVEIQPEVESMICLNSNSYSFGPYGMGFALNNQVRYVPFKVETWEFEWESPLSCLPKAGLGHGFRECKHCLHSELPHLSLHGQDRVHGRSPKRRLFQLGIH
jgi:hypothetical protein